MNTKQTQIKIDSESDFPRAITLIEQPDQLQIQISQDDDESFIDLQIPEVSDLKNQLSRFLDERRPRKLLNLSDEYILKNNFPESDENGYYQLTDSLDINIDYAVYCGRKFIMHLEYLDQLQNLLFALTGDRLDTSK